MKRRLLIAAAAIGLGLGHAASAATLKPFTSTAFAASQQGGQPVLVEVYAPWCPICARQQPILEKLETDPRFAGVTVFRVQFDSQKSVLRDLRVGMQSTLIGYRGKTETGRLVGVVRNGPIEALFASTLKA